MERQLGKKVMCGRSSPEYDKYTSEPALHMAKLGTYACLSARSF